MQDWNPALYLRFANERTRPAAELLARLPVILPMSAMSWTWAAGRAIPPSCW
jgi:trans-aconitate 2-methyltransferase